MAQQCDGCRFWSEMVAQAWGGGPMEALCLSEKSPYHSKYTTSRRSCDAWKSNHHGAVDAPPNYGELARAAYEAEEGESACA